MMKKYLFGLTTLAFSIITLCSNASNIVNVTLNNDQQSVAINIQQSDNINERNGVENWYKFLATNDWKVFITRDTWVNKFLAVFRSTLLGRASVHWLLVWISQEISSWTSSGNRNFSDWEYWMLSTYIYNHSGDISQLFFSNSAINRIVFKTDSSVRWVSINDASV
ncbi:MAG: hypothetical protein REH79_01355 [Spiroplasma sp.]|nr:hypothetical protein [Spiroplasma sp.]